MAPRALITGASGLLGAPLVERFLAAGWEVVAASRRVANACPGAERALVDFEQPGSAAALVARVRPAWVLNCAALVDVDQSQSRPELARRLNTELPAELGEACASSGARLLHVSTEAMLEGEPGLHREDHPPTPSSVYAQSKLGGEQVLLERWPQTFVARGTFYGWNLQPKRSLSEWIVGSLRAGEKITGFYDQVFTPLLSTHFAGLLLEAVERDLGGLYHVPARGALSKYEFALRLAHTFGLDASLIARGSVSDFPFRAPRPKVTSLCGEKLEAALGHPLPSVDEGIAEFHAQEARGVPARFKSWAHSGLSAEPARSEPAASEGEA